jgi:hypothetical protein
MDPHLPPFLQNAYARGPVTRFEVRETKKGGTENIVRIVDPGTLSPTDLATKIWEVIEDDYSGHIGERKYIVVYFRPGNDKDPAERQGFWLKGDQSSTDPDPRSRLLESQERALAAREAHIQAMSAHMLDQNRMTVAVQQAMIKDLSDRLNKKEDREQATIELYAELSDKKAIRQIEMKKEERLGSLQTKLESFGMQLFGEMTKGKDGNLQPSVQNEMIQTFVDSLEDAQLGTIMSSLRADQQGALVTVLRPFIEKALAKRQAAAAAAAVNVPAPTVTVVTNVETNGITHTTSAPPKEGAPS